MIDKIESQEGEHFKKVIIMSEEEAWDIIFDSIPFYNGVGILTRAFRELSPTFIEKYLKKRWQSKGFEPYKEFYVRSDGKVEMEING